METISNMSIYGIRNSHMISSIAGTLAQVAQRTVTSAQYRQRRLTNSFLIRTEFQLVLTNLLAQFQICNRRVMQQTTVELHSMFYFNDLVQQGKKNLAKTFALQYFQHSTYVIHINNCRKQFAGHIQPRYPDERYPAAVMKCKLPDFLSCDVNVDELM